MILFDIIAYDFIKKTLILQMLTQLYEVVHIKRDIPVTLTLEIDNLLTIFLLHINSRWLLSRNF